MEFNATFIVSAISFIVFTLIMNKLLYKPITDIIAKRQAFFDANSAAEKQNLENAQMIKDDKDAKIQTSKANAKARVMSEVELLKKEREKTEAQKKAELAQEVADKKAELGQEKERISSEMNSQVEDIASAIISKLTGGAQ